MKSKLFLGAFLLAVIVLIGGASVTAAFADTSRHEVIIGAGDETSVVVDPRPELTRDVPAREVGAAMVASSPYTACCDTLGDPMERSICRFAASIYPDGLLTNWPNPRIPGHYDHAPMFVYPHAQTAVSESASMLALYAARIGCEPLFEALFDVSAPAELGGTGAPMSSTQESPYYFASPNLGLLHWKLDANGYKVADNGWLANAAGEENRWLEALAIADQEFADPRYRPFANWLAWGLMGATDFHPHAIGNFEDPGTPAPFDDRLMRHRFSWQDDFGAFDTITGTNLSYNNLMGFRYAVQLGQEPHTLYQTESGAGLTEVITVPMQAIEAITISMTKRGTDWGYSLYEVEAYNSFTSTNLFLGADCDESSYQDDVNCITCTCAKALDGIIADNSRWASAPPWQDDEWLVITPAQPTRVTTITLRWEAAYASGYNVVATYPFADFYDKVLSYTVPMIIGSVGHCGTPLPRVMYDVERHVYWGEIDQREVVTATASSSQAPDLGPEKAVDRDFGTRWSSAHNDDEWIALEFPQPLTVDRVVLRWEAAFGKKYAIDISDDGVTWTMVYVETDGDGGVDEIYLPPTITRHIRMRGIERGTGWGYSLWEFEVYGGISSLTALDLARRAAAYARETGDPALWQVGKDILDWYKARYPNIAAAYDPCTGDPLPGGWRSEWPSVMADLAELAAEYGDCRFACQVIDEKLRTEWSKSPAIPFNGSAFDNLEVLLTLRRVYELCVGCEFTYLPLVARDY